MENSNPQEDLDEAMAVIEQQGGDLGMDLDELAEGAEYPHKASPVLERLDKSRQPKDGIICKTCPHSLWFTSPREVKCYCRVMYLVSWSNKEPNEITDCDGPGLLV